MAPLLVLLGVTAVGVAVLALTSPREVSRRWPVALRWGLAAMFLVTGTTHFVWLREDLVAMVPPQLPAPAALVTVTGVLEIVGAAGLLLRRTAAPAAAGLALLLVLMFPANVHAALADLSVGGQPPTGLWPRAAMQVLFLATAVTVWATHRPASGRERPVRPDARSRT